MRPPIPCPESSNTTRVQSLLSLPGAPNPLCACGPKYIIKEAPGFPPRHPSLTSEPPRDTSRPSCGLFFQRRDLRCLLFGPWPLTGGHIQEQARASPMSHPLWHCPAAFWPHLPLSGVRATVVVCESVLCAHYCARMWCECPTRLSHASDEGTGTSHVF